MRLASQRFFVHSCIYLQILIISYLALATFLGTNSLSVLKCRKTVNQSIIQKCGETAAIDYVQRSADCRIRLNVHVWRLWRHQCPSNVNYNWTPKRAKRFCHTSYASHHKRDKNITIMRHAGTLRCEMCYGVEWTELRWCSKVRWSWKRSCWKHSDRTWTIT